MIPLIKDIENNTWVMAIAVIVANLGINFIKEDLSEKQQDILNNCVLRKVYIFSLIYCSTKNLLISLTATLLYAVIVSLLNPKD